MYLLFKCEFNPLNLNVKSPELQITGEKEKSREHQSRLCSCPARHEEVTRGAANWRVATQKTVDQQPAALPLR